MAAEQPAVERRHAVFASGSADLRRAEIRVEILQAFTLADDVVGQGCDAIAGEVGCEAVVTLAARLAVARRDYDGGEGACALERKEQRRRHVLTRHAVKDHVFGAVALRAGAPGDAGDDRARSLGQAADQRQHLRPDLGLTALDILSRADRGYGALAGGKIRRRHAIEVADQRGAAVLWGLGRANRRKEGGAEGRGAKPAFHVSLPEGRPRRRAACRGLCAHLGDMRRRCEARADREGRPLLLLRDRRRRLSQATERAAFPRPADGERCPARRAARPRCC